jgi:hypothetical protein
VKKLLSSLFALALVASLGSSAWAQVSQMQTLAYEVVSYKQLTLTDNAQLNLTIDPDVADQFEAATALTYATNSSSNHKITMTTDQGVGGEDLWVEVDMALSETEVAQGGGGGYAGDIQSVQNLNNAATYSLVENIQQARGTLTVTFGVALFDGDRQGDLAAAEDKDVLLTFDLMAQ